MQNGGNEQFDAHSSEKTGHSKNLTSITHGKHFIVTFVAFFESNYMKKQDVVDALNKVPSTNEQGSLIEAGHVKNVQVFGDEVVVDVFCMKASLQAKKKLEVDILKAIHDHAYEKAKVKVNVTVPEEVKQQAQSAPQIKGDKIPGVKNIIAVASGKGGVGKSTVAVNIAAALARTGASVGLMDTDIYGPSIPTMFDLFDRPNITTQKKLVPLEKYGIKMVSMGFLVDVNQAMVATRPIVC